MNNRMTSNQTLVHNHNSKSTNNLLPQLRRNESLNSENEVPGAGPVSIDTHNSSLQSIPYADMQGQFGINTNKSISLYNKNSFYQRFMLNNRQAKTGTGFDNFGRLGSLGSQNRNGGKFFNNDPYSS